MTTADTPQLALRRWRVSAMIGLAVLIAGASVGTTLMLTGATDSPQADTIPVRGSLTLDADGSLSMVGRLESDCAGNGGYSDIREGTQVTVTGPAGTVLAVGKLGPGAPQGSGTTFDLCKFLFDVPDVPSGQGFYGVEVASRGAVSFSEQDLVGGRIDLSLGG